LPSLKIITSNWARIVLGDGGSILLFFCTTSTQANGVQSPRIWILLPSTPGPDLQVQNFIFSRISASKLHHKTKCLKRQDETTIYNCPPEILDQMYFKVKLEFRIFHNILSLIQFKFYKFWKSFVFLAKLKVHFYVSKWPRIKKCVLQNVS
jgi:hypothetical protein